MNLPVAGFPFVVSAATVNANEGRRHTLGECIIREDNANGYVVAIVEQGNREVFIPRDVAAIVDGTMNRKPLFPRAVFTVASWWALTHALTNYDVTAPMRRMPRKGAMSRKGR